MAQPKPFNLFIYGTLVDPSVFRAVTGRELVVRVEDADGVNTVLAREAVLDSYNKISPDHTYLYAVPDPHGRIRGLLVGPLPAQCMAALRVYEGRNYSRRTLNVMTKDGPTKAVVFVGNLDELKHSFGHAFRDPLKQEVLLGRKIEAALLEAEREQLHTTERISRRAVAELRGSTIRDLVRLHFESGGISDYAILHSLKDPPLRDFTRIGEDPEARALAPHYLSMVVRQVMFNQFEERIRRDFRYELDHAGLSDRYYDRSISSLVALRMLNGARELMDMLVGDCLTELHFPQHRLVDFVRWAIVAADHTYERRLAKEHLNFVLGHMGSGYIALGAELEFSNIGHGVIRDPEGRELQDPRYDGFLYFSDFALDVLTWKLGGHIDDHHEKAAARPRRGFFEAALGSLSIAADISKPITDDPWLLNQLIHEVRRFFEIAPHSVHISLQLRSQHRPVRDRLLPLSHMKCLFAIAGDLYRRADGSIRINRLATDEIITFGPGAPRMLFSEIRKRYSSEADEQYPPARAPGKRGTYVQQFRFLRLSPELNFEPIAMALKGLQISRRPGSFLVPAQFRESRRHRELFMNLLEWGVRPARITETEIEAFLASVYQGLMSERRGKPAHSEAYVTWAITELRQQLDRFNRAVGRGPKRRPRPAGRGGANKAKRPL
jgi:hypothetical protein